MNYCTECGTKNDGKGFFCVNCSAELLDKNMSTYTNSELNKKIEAYNQKVTSKPKSKNNMFVGLVVVAVLLVVMIGIGSASYRQNIEDEKEAYIQKCEYFLYEVLDAGSNLENIADTTQEYWYDSIWNNYYYGDIDIAIKSALDDMSYEIESSYYDYVTVKALYDELKNPSKKIQDYQIESLNEVIEDLYDAYVNYYEFTTNPSGSYNSFSNLNIEYASDIVREIKIFKRKLD